MTDVMARIGAITCTVLVAISIAVLWITSSPGIRGTPVKAEFQDVYPLLEGMHVRVEGSVAGSVRDIEVTDRGTAIVTVQLNEGTDPPRSDATAAIRQEDITGDSYFALSPGTAEDELGDEVIPMSRTIVTPRFDDLLNAFDEPVREGLRMLIGELGMALERRGADVNAAVLRLRPALTAAHDALAEVESQNDALRRIVADAEDVTGQAAGRSEELDRLVEGLAAVLQTTAEREPELDRALEVAPQTARAARGTLRRLGDTAQAARPAAVALGDAAPELVTAAKRLEPFLDDADAILRIAAPSLDATRRLFVMSEPTLKADPQRVLTAPFDLAAANGALLDALLGDATLQKALFGADTDAGRMPGDPSDDRGLGAVPVELGTQDGYPADYDPERRFLRAVAVPSCEMFGLKVEPGCLARLVAPARKRGARPKADRKAPRNPARDLLDDKLPGLLPRPRVPDAVDKAKDTVDDAVDGAKEKLDDTLDGALPSRPQPPEPEPPKSDGDGLLDFLLGR